MHRLLAAADSAILVELDGDRETAAAAALRLEALLRAAAVTGVVETVPGLRSLLVEYDCLRTSHAELAAALEGLLVGGGSGGDGGAPWRDGRLVVLPLGVSSDLGPDLGLVAERCGCSADEVVDLICGVEHRVAMLGNLPGLPYLLGLPPRLHLPRRARPRESVPAGSVAVAAGLTCVYPMAAPGGWHIVGATVADLFSVGREPLCLLAPGDRVRFEPVGPSGLARPGA